jgi:phospholipase C
VLTAAACAPAGTSPSAGPGPARTGAPNAAIAHVVVIVQENRSFDNLFAGFPGADAPAYGYAGNSKVALRSVPLESPYILENNYSDAIAAWANGAMNGFNLEHYSGSGPRLLAYAVVPRRESAPYWQMAKQYALADHMFPTEFGPSFTAHLNLIGGNTELTPGVAEVDFPTAVPWGCDAPKGTITATLTPQHGERYDGPFPCFDRLRTLADTLDAAGVSWRYYAPAVRSGLDGEAWSEFSAIRSVRYGPDWSKVTSPETTVLSDIAAGKLPAVSWVSPDMQNSDHPASGGNTGPSWVASVVNAIGESPYWQSSAIVVLWDDWGGWYDDAVPPQLDFRGLGIRVPCIVISPYARHGYVSHTQYEFGSVLKFIEDTFRLPVVGPADMGYTDARAASVGNILDPAQSPRAFTPIAAPYSRDRFVHETPSYRAPDDR